MAHCDAIKPHFLAQKVTCARYSKVTQHHIPSIIAMKEGKSSHLATFAPHPKLAQVPSIAFIVISLTRLVWIHPFRGINYLQ